MKITNQLIEALEPCKDRLDNYLKFYKDKELTTAQFMGLNNITQNDKLWVAFRLMPRENIGFAAADIAELTIPLFESKYPKDKRPRLAIEAARNKNISYAAANAAAHDAYAADDADDDDAYAAYAAAYTAAYAAYAAANAAYDAAYYVTNYCAYYDVVYAAAYAADAADNADNYNTCKKNIEKQIRKIALKYMKK